MRVDATYGSGLSASRTPDRVAGATTRVASPAPARVSAVQPSIDEEVTVSATPGAKKTAINPDNVWKPEDYFNIYLQPGLEKTPPENAGWAQGARKGPFVFISGQTPTLPDGTTISKDMHAQLRQALVNFRNVVAAEGGTLEDVVQIRYYFCAGYMEEGLAALRDVGGEFWSYPFPSTTCVEVVRVAWSDHLLEIEGMAILGD